jgi:serine/threonine-protein phosphatase PGAM5
MFHSLITLLIAVVALATPCLANAAEESTAATKPASRTLYLIRHGNYDEADKSDDAVGRHLTTLGIAQSKLLAARLRTLPNRIDDIVASPLTRARETAAVLTRDLGNVPVRVMADLAECTPPTRSESIMAKEKPEDLAKCKAQMERLVTELFQTSKTGERHELVVCHGNVTRWLVARALGVDVEAWATLSIGHASLTIIRIQPTGSPRVLAVGDVGHLPTNLQTGRIDTPALTLSVP